MRAIENPNTIDEETAAAALATKLQGVEQKRSRAWYRVQATRKLTAGAKMGPNQKAKQV